MEKASHRRGLIDTDILVDVSRGLSESAHFINEMVQSDCILISDITAMELIAGCRDSKQLQSVKQLISSVSVVPITQSVSFRARTLMETFSLSHSIGIPDALIASTAMESGVALYTRNVRHYKMIPELLVIQPY